MNKALITVLAFGTLIPASQALGQIVFYENEWLRGRVFSANGPVDNFENYGFNDRASSAIVERGEWEVCDDAYYQGRCVTLRPGQYNSLGSFAMNKRISSVRPMRAPPQYSYAPAPPPGPVYEYYPHHGEQLFQADVVAVRAVVGPPEQRCWVERQDVAQDNHNVPGAIIGGVIGGVLGHQVGEGRGNTAATVGGAALGAAIGSNVNRGPDAVYSQDVQRCAYAPSNSAPAYWDVTYDFRGMEHHVQMSAPPGPTIAVDRDGNPRM
jgi:uncharacterized protein YcfJ